MTSKEEQDDFYENIFSEIQGNTFSEFMSNHKEYCIRFKTKIIEEETYNFTVNIISYLVTNLLLPFFMQYQLYDMFTAPYDKIDTLNSMFVNEGVYSGRLLKQYNLTSWISEGKSLELLKSCDNNAEYCMMNPKYIIIDSVQRVEYYCNINDSSKIMRINEHIDLQLVGNATYLYCIIPSGLLCLFHGHHSGGACGQPVICAGHITIKDHKIIKITNASGHYSPPPHMLYKALVLLKEKGIINEMKESSQENDYIKTFVTEEDFITRGGNILTKKRNNKKIKSKKKRRN